MTIKNFIAALTAFLAVLCFIALPQQPRAEPIAAIDRLNIPGPIRFANTDFYLAWSAKNPPAYYKQEYVPRGETVETYRSMLLVEAIFSDNITIRQAVSAQIRTIKERKKSDPVTNFAVMAKEGSDEIILDFIMQAKSPKGELITEWNAYRYKTVSGPTKGIALFAISRRAYGEAEALAFLKTLKETRSTDVNHLATTAFPDIRINQNGR